MIITRNDYARGLFNGDVGIALRVREGLRVWFEVSDRDGNSRPAQLLATRPARP